MMIGHRIKAETQIGYFVAEENGGEDGEETERNFKGADSEAAREEEIEMISPKVQRR